jgi:AraC family transcriptional regulator of adaptative response / DNA-3-methyladenine glycosylase II
MISSEGLNPEICFRALKSRDRRLEGRFVVAVKTTKIYCRLGCPAPIPKQKNVVFLSCAAAAEEAGFRPCRRCRPEIAAQVSTWPDTSRTVTRALRLIAEGALDGDGGVAELADQLGITERHLRRLFANHLGASPISVAQTQRVHLARRLLEDTSCSIMEIALSSGFSSLRRFNYVYRKTFAASPSLVRRQKSVEKSNGITLRISYKPPYEWDSINSFLAGRAIPGVEFLEPLVYRRSVLINAGPAGIEIGPVRGEDCLQLSIHTQLPADLLMVVEKVRRIFDLGCDPKQVEECLAKDRRLAPLVNRWPGLRVPGAWDPFETAIRAILGQQVSVRAATTLAGRLVKDFGTPIEVGLPQVTHLFPTAGKLAKSDLSRIGIPRSRAKAIQDFSQAVESRKVALDGSKTLEETVASLTALPGIGNWTAHYIAMRALGEPDAFPCEDLGIKKALFGNRKKSTKAETLKIAEGWRPFRAYATMLLWRTLA